MQYSTVQYSTVQYSTNYAVDVYYVFIAFYRILRSSTVQKHEFSDNTVYSGVHLN